MSSTASKNFYRWLLILGTLTVLSLILWNTYVFFQNFKKEERSKMEIWASALTSLNNANLSDTELELPLTIITLNTTIPIIQTTEQDSIISMSNVEEDLLLNQIKSKEYLEKLKSQNSPIAIKFGDKTQYIYYGNSSLLTKLTYYPAVLILVFILFSIMILSFYRASRMALQNKLWAGMAKETAHQIGTPLSSLLGWVEIMKLDQVDETTVSEIEKDVNRLEFIANRFSKIGSKPQLKESDIIAETEQTFRYTQSRSSQKIHFYFQAPQYPIEIPLNKDLHSWTIENLIKNAIDAMKGMGEINLTIIHEAKYVKILITDTGKGIPKGDFKKIFEPGFTTKTRGWGLGLSLTKRIVEEFQNGTVKVLHSEMEKGSTFCISYKLNTKQKRHPMA